ncbi:GDP-mannose 4,6-dehydratase [Frigoribacterium sp. 2-23]|uniref:GDP-mannose 4,6-dehydratase n=1 Tax=Frigoribacterium sp. 2-23 TaxID=3415006 RepID=UPI003C6F9E46
MRVLVTGIGGQTGSYFAEKAIARGWECVGLVRSRDQIENGLPTEVRTVEADLLDLEGVARAVRDERPDTIVNLAGLSSVAASWQQPVETASINGLAVANLLATVSQLKDDGHPCQFIQASSAEIFGAAVDAIQSEASPLAPMNPYGASKAYGHVLVGAYRATGVRAVSAILYNHESPRRPSAFVTRKITQGAVEIALGRQEYLALGNLDAARDWGWAPDVAEALVLMVEARSSEDFVVATGRAHTVREFAEAALTAAGLSDVSTLLRVDPRFQRPSDAPTLVGDSTRLRDTLGWKPTVTFEQIVEAMVAEDFRLARA